MMFENKYLIVGSRATVVQNYPSPLESLSVGPKVRRTNNCPKTGYIVRPSLCLCTRARIVI
jgi:hypothetical protein